MQDVAGCKSRASDVLKMSLAERHGNPSAACSPQSLAGGVPQFPLLSNCIKFKEVNYYKTPLKFKKVQREQYNMLHEMCFLKG